jgi:hypothetical protein
MFKKNNIEYEESNHIQNPIGVVAYLFDTYLKDYGIDFIMCFRVFPRQETGNSPKVGKKFG